MVKSFTVGTSHTAWRIQKTAAVSLASFLPSSQSVNTIVQGGTSLSR